jgi:uncharacterized protein
MGNSALLKTLNVAEYVNEQFGAPTVNDIIKELDKPGRDPRGEFKTANFQEGVETLKDLRSGMILEGVITNVANFGAFVDIGVHQDGLVHKSVIADHYVSEPSAVVKVGDIVKVKVLEVDLERKRVSLSMRLTEKPQSSSSYQKNNQARQATSSTKPTRNNTQASSPKPKRVMEESAMGAALRAALVKKD